MTEHLIPDIATLETWLKQLGVPSYLCGQCPGLHLEDIHALEGVMDARLLVEPDGVVLSVELEIRPSMLLGLNAELSYLAMSFPSLKVFLDVVDEDTPRLVLADTLLTGAGVSFEQFSFFLKVTLEQVHKVVADCQQQGYLLLEIPKSESGAGKFH